MTDGTAGTDTTLQTSDADVAAIDRMRETCDRLRREIARVIIGQDEVITQLLICLLCRGHALLMGVPGLAKTLLVQTISDLMQLQFSRIQFTPDLMPSDITGTEILQETDIPGRRAFEFVPGPIFANVVLADEINRTPPKTQAALLQAMQEQAVNYGSKRYPLAPPFFVLATQNPIEQEGTYPLPEAQLDRFMFLIRVDYPTEEQERRIARETTGEARPTLKPLLSGPEILAGQRLIRRVPIPEHVIEYIVRLVRRSRPVLPESPNWVRRWVQWGAGPRAVQYLVLGTRAHAVLRGSYLVQVDDVHAIATPVLEHRILTNFHAESEGIDSREIIRRLIAEVSAD